jgi:hypothetical protein
VKILKNRIFELYERLVEFSELFLFWDNFVSRFRILHQIGVLEPQKCVFRVSSVENMHFKPTSGIEKHTFNNDLMKNSKSTHKVVPEQKKFEKFRQSFIGFKNPIFENFHLGVCSNGKKILKPL